MQLIDAKGKNCPMPVVMAKKEIDAGSAEFAVEVDNATAKENLKRLAESQQFDCSVAENGGIYRLTFTKSGCESCEETNILTAQSSQKQRWSVFVGKESVGGGDEELGQSLMKMFFYTLSQSDDLPASILFMNAGVKLPALNEQVVEHLRVLYQKHVEILVCGTCLNFYGIAERLRVGTVSNMYDILERMKQVDKVITL